MDGNLKIVGNAGYEGIRKKIDAYKTAIEELIQSGYTMRDSVSKYIGMGKVQKSPLHRQLYDDVALEVDVLVQELNRVPDDWLAARAASTILNYGREEDGEMDESIRLAMISIEALAIPLLSYMNTDEIEELKTVYEEKYPRREMLPKQKELYQEMCACTGGKKAGKAFGFWRRR